MMTRTFVVSAALWLAFCGPAWAEQAQFHTPSKASEVVTATDSAVTLRYDPAEWTVSNRVSDWRMFAIVRHVNPAIVGSIVYRDGPATEAEVRERAVAELEMFGDQDVTFARRMVNDVSVLFMKGTATETGGDTTAVRAYYWIGPSGVVEYAVMAPSEDFQSHRDAIMGLLNGLEIDTQHVAR